MSAALFPGQGVQAPGMDLGLTAVASDVFDTASEILGTDVAELCRTGEASSASLSSTRWAQPAVLVCSVASFRELAKHEQPFSAVAGHSVGEYAALVACEAIGFADAVSLIAKRAEITSEIAHHTDGAMAALLRIDIDDAVRLCTTTNVALAADNAAGQCVVSGPTPAIEAAIEAASGMRAMARRLEVDGAFHSPLMAPAAGALADALSSVEISPPTIDFWSSTTASRLDDPDAIRRSLLDQLTSTVRWRETVAGLVEATEVATVTDIGPGKVVGGLSRRIVPDTEVRFAADVLPAVAAS